MRYYRILLSFRLDFSNCYTRKCLRVSTTSILFHSTSCTCLHKHVRHVNINSSSYVTGSYSPACEVPYTARQPILSQKDSFRHIHHSLNPFRTPGKSNGVVSLFLTFYDACNSCTPPDATSRYLICGGKEERGFPGLDTLPPVPAANLHNFGVTTLPATSWRFFTDEPIPFDRFGACRRFLPQGNRFPRNPSGA